MAKATNGLNAWASDIDLEATRQLLAELQVEGKPWDKLESDPKKYVTNYRRICPKRLEWQNPYQIIPVHYLGPNSRMVVCLKEAGLGDCPACQLRWTLQEGKDEDAARQLRPAIRTFLNVVRINQDGSLAEEKVFLMGLNQIQFLGKRGVEYDPDEESDLPLFYFFEKYGDLSHVETGRDLAIKAKEEKSGDYDVLTLKFSVADASPFPGTGELLEEGLNDLTTVAAVTQPNEMMALIEGRATGALVLGAGAPVDTPTTQAVTPAPQNRFGGDTPEEEPAEEPKAPAAKPEEEPAPEDAKASKAPPKTDPTAALERLRKSKGV